MSEQNKPEVIRKESANWVLAVRVRLRRGRQAYDLTTTTEFGLSDWEPTDYDKAVLFSEDLDALSLWWLKKNPHLLTSLQPSPSEDVRVLRGPVERGWDSGWKVGDDRLTPILHKAYQDGDRFEVTIRRIAKEVSQGE